MSKNLLQAWGPPALARGVVSLVAPYGYFERFATVKRKNKKPPDFRRPFITCASLPDGRSGDTAEGRRGILLAGLRWTPNGFNTRCTSGIRVKSRRPCAHLRSWPQSRRIPKTERPWSSTKPIAWPS
jgi:hypothetical protein